MTTVYLVKDQTIKVVNSMLDWLDSLSSNFEFTGEGISVIEFENELDAIAFKLRFDI